MSSTPSSPIGLPPAPIPGDGASRRLVGWLAAALAVAALVGLLIGPSGIGIPGAGPGAGPGRWEAARLILLEIRLPRVLLAMLVGGALGLSGAVLQGYLRNPLAEPALLGISGGAALGAVAAIHSGAAALFGLALPLGGLLGAAIAGLAVLALAGRDSGPLTLILCGVAVASLAGALTSLALNLSPNPFASVEIMFWLMGSLADRSMAHVWLAGPLILAGGALLWRTRTALDALSLGEDAAQNLGADPDRLRRDVIGGVALAVGAATAIAGSIGFIGLVVPHLLRPFVGYAPSRLLAPSALGGAALLTFADAGLRLLSPFGELRLGVVTALIGAPFFLWLVVRTRSELAP